MSVVTTPRVLLRDQALVRLREAIVTGELLPLPSRSGSQVVRPTDSTPGVARSRSTSRS